MDIKHALERMTSYCEEFYYRSDFDIDRDFEEFIVEVKAMLLDIDEPPHFTNKEWADYWSKYNGTKRP